MERPTGYQLGPCCGPEQRRAARVSWGLEFLPTVSSTTATLWLPWAQGTLIEVASAEYSLARENRRQTTGGWWPQELWEDSVLLTETGKPWGTRGPWADAHTIPKSKLGPKGLSVAESHPWLILKKQVSLSWKVQRRWPTVSPIIMEQCYVQD